MTTFQERLEKIATIGVFENPDSPTDRYFHITQMGVGVYRAEEFNRQGKRLSYVNLNEEELMNFDFVEEHAAPQALRRFYPPQNPQLSLQSSTQSSLQLSNLVHYPAQKSQPAALKSAEAEDKDPASIGLRRHKEVMATILAEGDPFPFTP